MCCPTNLAYTPQDWYQLAVVIFFVFCMFPEKSSNSAARATIACEYPIKICTKLFKDVELFFNIYYDNLFVGEFGTLVLPSKKLATRIPFLPFFYNFNNILG